MRKLRIALIAMFAMVMSLALFACGGGKSDWIDEITVSGTGSITITDAAKEADARTELDKLTFTAIYFNGTEDRTIPASEYTVDWSGVKFGTTGNYTAVVTTEKDNRDKLTANVTVTINHNFSAADSEGVQVCSVCSAVSQTKTINDSFSIKAWHDGVTVGDKNEYVLLDPRYGNATTVVGRLDKGMSIKLVGTGKSTSVANAYYYPVLGVGNLEEGGAILQRNDNWSIYNAMSNGPLAWSTLSANKDAITTGWPGVEAAEENVVYVDGTISSATDYNVEAGIPVELTWEYSEDGVFTMTWYNPSLDNGRLRTARVKLPDRQFYNAILHGEEFTATFTQVQIIQSLKLKEVGTASVKDAQKVLENKYLDASSLDIDVTYEGGKTGKADAGLLTVYGNTDTVTELPKDNTEKGGMNYNGEGAEWVDLTTAGTAAKVSGAYKSYKVRVALGNDWFEQLLSAEATKAITDSIVKNAVDHGNSNDVKAGEVTFPATTLSTVEFVQTSDNKTGVNISGTAATLTTAQAAALTLGSGSAKHYVAFSLYADGATKFDGTPAVSGTKGYVATAADGARLDVVLAVSADVKTATISGVNGGTDIVVSFGEIGSVGVTSTMDITTLKLNESKTLTIVYDLAGVSGVTDNATVAANIKLVVNGVNKSLTEKDGKLAPQTANVTGFEGLTIGDITFASGKLTVKYTIPKMDPSKPTGYTFALLNGNTTLITDRLFYDLSSFVADDDAVTAGYYTVADGNYLYLLKPYAASDIKTAELHETVSLSLNAGAETGKGAKASDPDYKTYTYLKAHDLSFTVNADGTVAFTNSMLLKDLASGSFTVFGGAANNSEDTDYGAVVVLKIDTRKVGVEKQSYAFEVNSDPSAMAYVPVTYDESAKTYTMGKAVSYTFEGKQTVTVNDVDPDDCTSEVTSAYELGGAGEATKFYAGLSYTKNDHKWIKEGTTDTLATGLEDAFCSQCGAKRFTKSDENGSYTFEAIIPLRDVENPDEDPTTWWASPTANTPVTGNFVVRYTWNNTDAAYPGDGAIEILDADDNPFGYRTFIADYNPPFETCKLCDTGSTQTTVFKKNGSVVANIFGDAAPQGVVPESWAGDADVLVYRYGTTLVIDATLKIGTDSYQAVTTITKFTTKDVSVRINGNHYFCSDIKMSIGTLASQTTKFGAEYQNREYQSGAPAEPEEGKYYTWRDWVELPALTKGHSITVTGTLKGGDDVWKALIWEFKDAMTGRLDNYCWEFGSANLGHTPDEDSKSTYGVRTFTPELGEDVFKDRLVAVMAECTYKLTFAWVDETTITVHVELTAKNAEAGSYDCLYTFPNITVPADNQFGIHLCGEWCTISFETLTVS